MKQFVLTKNTWGLEKASLNLPRPRFSDFWRPVNSYHCPLNCTYLFLAVRGLDAAQSFSGCSLRGCSPAGAHALLSAAAPRAEGPGPGRGWAGGAPSGFRSRGPRALDHRLSSPDARASLPLSMWGLPGPGTELSFLHRQADSSPLSHRGSACHSYFKVCPDPQVYRLNHWNNPFP